MLLTQNPFYLHQKKSTGIVTSYTQQCLLMISFHVRRQTFIQFNTFSFTDTVSTVCVQDSIYDSILHITKNSNIKLNHTMVIPFVYYRHSLLQSHFDHIPWCIMPFPCSIYLHSLSLSCSRKTDRYKEHQNIMITARFARAFSPDCQYNAAHSLSVDSREYGLCEIMLF